MKFVNFLGRANDLAVGLAAYVALAWLIILAVGALQAFLNMPQGAIWVLGAFFTVGIPAWALLRRPTTPA